MSIPHMPDDPAAVPETAHGGVPERPGWDSPTYYGRPQLKAAPFSNWVVGGYIFLAGLSGASAILSTVADLTRGRQAEGTVRRGRYLSLLAPTLGSVLLIWDLHTPQRFYNMLRIAKRTSPMSIGTWILMSFSGFAGATAAAQFAADHLGSGRRWLRAARAGQVPAALAGAGLSTYTASLLAATSTPLWAAAPQALAVRFGSSSVAAGAAALSFGEGSPRNRAALQAVTVAALAAELAATVASHRQYEASGVADAFDSGWGRAERLGATGAGILLPLGLYAASYALRRGRPRMLSRLAGAAVLAGSALLRISIMGTGDVSASRPEVSFRFSQPRNLPPARAGGGPARARRQLRRAARAV